METGWAVVSPAAARVFKPRSLKWEDISHFNNVRTIKEMLFFFFLKCICLCERMQGLREGAGVPGAKS